MAPLPRSDMGPFLPYALVFLQVSTWGQKTPQLVPLFGHTASSFQLAQTSFERSLYLQKYSWYLVQVILPSHTPYEDGTDRMFRNVGT